MIQSKQFPDLFFRDSAEAFKNAITQGVLTESPDQDAYAGNWMYMHTEKDGRDAFKNIITRRYILVNNEKDE